MLAVDALLGLSGRDDKFRGTWSAAEGSFHDGAVGEDNIDFRLVVAGLSAGRIVHLQDAVSAGGHECGPTFWQDGRGESGNTSADIAAGQFRFGSTRAFCRGNAGDGFSQSFGSRPPIEGDAVMDNVALAEADFDGLDPLVFFESCGNDYPLVLDTAIGGNQNGGGIPKTTSGSSMFQPSRIEWCLGQPLGWLRAGAIGSSRYRIDFRLREARVVAEVADGRTRGPRRHFACYDGRIGHSRPRSHVNTFHGETSLLCDAFTHSSSRLLGASGLEDPDGGPE